MRIWGAGQFCAYSCGRCSSYIYSPPPPGNVYCADLEPGGDYTCQQQAFIFNKCDADFIIAGMPLPLTPCGTQTKAVCMAIDTGYPAFAVRFKHWVSAQHTGSKPNLKA